VLGGGGARGGVEVLQVHKRERAGLRCRDPLHRNTVRCAEGGAQRLVPGDDGIEAAPKDGWVQRTAHAHSAGDVIKGAVGDKLIDEPEALLREGKGEEVAARDVGDRRHLRAGAVLLSPCDLLRQFGDGRVLEERLDREVNLEGLAYAGDSLGGEQTVPTQREEVVVDTDLVDTEQSLPYLSDRLLEKCLRRNVRVGEIRPGMSGQRPGALLWSRVPPRGLGTLWRGRRQVGRVGAYRRRWLRFMQGAHCIRIDRIILMQLSR
jgi:hypothetical protein